MSSEAVKKQILTAISALNIPLIKRPDELKVEEACAAAKLLRNRVLREHVRVEEHIEILRQKQFYDDSDGESDNDGNSVFLGTESSDIRKLSRQDFLFISEMMVMENVVVPLLLAHGMNFSSSLLPQLLKLLTAMLLPVPMHSLEMPRQFDYIRRLVERCGTDEFFTLLIQCVAPVAEKRSKGILQKEDVVLLEVVLKIISHFFNAPKESIAPGIGAFARNHGIEFFLVVLNQNFARAEAMKKEEEIAALKDMELSSSEEEDNNDNIILVDNHMEEKEEEKKGIVVLEDGENGTEDGEEEEAEEDEEDESGHDEEEEEEEEGVGNNKDYAVDEISIDQYNARMLDLLESTEQLWKWNMLIVSSMAVVLRCANPVELAQLGFLSKFQQQSSHQLMGLFESGKRFRECKKESDRWRQVARSRNGAITSNGLLVRGTSSSRVQGEGGAIGSASVLLGLRSKDPLEKVRDIDLRKKGRFVKGMSDDSIAISNLPLPTKVQLSQQCLSFVCYGFEPLNMMLWNKIAKTIAGFESIVKERSELLSGFKSSGEEPELPSQIDKSVYDSAQGVLDYVDICASLLRYTREVVRLNKDENNDITLATFHQQWQCISSVITIEHIQYGFELLRVFLSSPDFKKRFDVTSVVIYLSELLMTLNHLIDGDIVKDPNVIVAANALSSSILYNEENVTLVFDLISRYTAKVLPPGKARVFVLLVYSVFQLMEKCSFKGKVLFPKREKRQNATITEEAEDISNVNFLESDKVENIDPLNLSHETINEVTKDEVDINENDNVLTSSNSVYLKDVPLEPLETTSGNKDREVSIENASLTSSGPAILSTLSSEREVSMGNYFKRLATVKNTKLILSSLRHWRVNDNDVNTALAYLIRSLVIEGSENIFFNAHFLMVMRDILVNGKDSHNSLYNVCDQVVFSFFNPSFAKFLDERKKSQFGSSLNVLEGAQSFLGFEVSLRCARSLFCFNSTDYSIMEEKGLPHLTDCIAIPLKDEKNYADRNEDDDTFPDAEESPIKKRRRKKKVSLTDEKIQEEKIIDEETIEEVIMELQDDEIVVE
ncbi:uncharacterized protein TM35_000101210 [Trypanosoma theileri]|uniref:Timeless N-terminal domain-containing protein n=1 Tax=Trypanosoma theileri TaxID=67003 RepID=A0A1X0NZD6_9TRYP|nr:uncharacterized protein TM35_000101210 [Trypanosoma theileri]ORC89853.1 hypothetical protein TM35_000101210 [Trypanosoma theileri]